MSNARLTAEEALQKLQMLWRKELQATRSFEKEQRSAVPLSERVRRGNALHKLRLDDVEAKIGGRALLWLRAAQPRDLDPPALGGLEDALPGERAHRRAIEDELDLGSGDRRIGDGVHFETSCGK